MNDNKYLLIGIFHKLIIIYYINYNFKQIKQNQDHILKLLWETISDILYS